MSSESPTDHEHFSVVGIYQHRKILLFDVADSKQKKKKKEKKKKENADNKQTNKSLLHHVRQFHGIKLGNKIAAKLMLHTVS